MNVAGELACRICIQQACVTSFASGGSGRGLKRCEDVGNDDARLRRGSRQRIVERRCKRGFSGV